MAYEFAEFAVVRHESLAFWRLSVGRLFFAAVTSGLVCAGSGASAQSLPNCEANGASAWGLLANTISTLSDSYQQAVANGDDALAQAYLDQIDWVDDCCAGSGWWASQSCGCHSPDVASDSSYDFGWFCSS